MPHNQQCILKQSNDFIFFDSENTVLIILLIIVMDSFGFKT